MNSVGSLSVSASYAGESLAGLAVRLERPPVTKLFIGQAPQAVLKTVPYLYTLCSRAQRLAAESALATAAGEDPGPAEAPALWAEALHEHFWRLLLDWPLALGLPQAKEDFIAWRAARSGGQLVESTFGLLEKSLLGCPVQAWQAGAAPAETSLAAACLARLGARPDSDIFDQPQLNPADWLAYWRAEQEGEPATASPVSVAGAWQARLKQCVQAALALAAGAAYPAAAAGGKGWGVGQTMTARGVLTHAAELQGGRVQAYRVWAPTDCHFADARALAGLLAAKTWPDIEAARLAVEQSVLALDPCLPYTVKVDNA